eukprot:7992667-Pyramimonas_sp.AAC.1
MTSTAATADDSSRTFLVTVGGAPCRLRWPVNSTLSSRGQSADSCGEALLKALGLPPHAPRLAEGPASCAG